MSLETELKLQIEPRHLARLAAHPLLKRAAKGVTRKLHSVYYDTPELDLWGSGACLRVRRSGKHWLQTVKSGAAVAAGLHQRHEFETTLAAPFPDFENIQSSEAAAYFSSPGLRERLQPVVVTEFTRTSRELTPADGVAIE